MWTGPARLRLEQNADYDPAALGASEGGLSARTTWRPGFKFPILKWHHMPTLLLICFRDATVYGLGASPQ